MGGLDTFSDLDRRYAPHREHLRREQDWPTIDRVFTLQILHVLPTRDHICHPTAITTRLYFILSRHIYMSSVSDADALPDRPMRGRKS
ncbi:hypothetical protein Plhal304r1_c035g0109201 [Plasmopara halstedii]